MFQYHVRMTFPDLSTCIDHKCRLSDLVPLKMMHKFILLAFASKYTVATFVPSKAITHNQRGVYEMTTIIGTDKTYMPAFPIPDIRTVENKLRVLHE